MNNGNQSSPLTIMAIIGALAVAVYVSSSILLSQGNQLAGLSFWITILCGVMGVLVPRLSFSLLVFQCAYIDLFKRLMIIAGKITFDELFYVLGIAPVTMVGIATGLALRMIFGQAGADIGHFKRFFLAVLLNVALGAVVYFKGGGIGGILREVANGSCYALLLFIVPLLFRTPEEVCKCTRFLLVVFIPVSIYAIYQQVYGFQGFEVDYLKTNLSIEVKQLEGDRVRAFATLNSPTSVSVVSMSLAAMAIGLALVGRRSPKLGMPLPLVWLVVLLGVGAWAASTVREGLLLLPVSVVGTFLFLRPSSTKWFYGTILGAFGLLVASSSYLYQNVEIWSGKLVELFGGSAYIEQMINMNTYKDRLSGFANILLNPAAYSMFGLSVGAVDDVVVHDPLSSALVSYGAVPLGIVLVLSAMGIARIHKVIFVMRNPTLQILAASFLANAAGNVAVTIVNGNLLGTFPVNVFFWVSLAFAVTLSVADRTAAANLPPEPVRSGSPQPMVPHRPVGRFAPVPRPAR